MSEDQVDGMVRRAMARRIYLSYCASRGSKPWKKTPEWAYEYADVAVDFLGYGDDVADMVTGQAVSA